MDLSKTRYYMGTSRGVLLCTAEKPGTFKVFKNQESSEVRALCEGRNPEELAVGYAGGNVCLFDLTKEAYQKTIDDLEGVEEVVEICCTENKLLVAKKDGIINLWNRKQKDYFSLNLDEKSSLEAMALSPLSSNIIATGGEDNDYKLWDIQTMKCVFKAKSLGHDDLQLPIPTSVRGITFVERVGACCTKEGHILLYDDRAQRKPIVKFLEPKASYTTISPAFRETQVMVGTNKGYLQWIDLKNPPKLLKTYTSFTGSVTDIVCDPVEPYVASTSLDRHLRVHNMETKELVSKIYVKQNLTKLLVRPIIKNEDLQLLEEGNSEEIDHEYEELFRNMDEVGNDKEVSTPKKRKSCRVLSKQQKQVEVKKKRKVNS